MHCTAICCLKASGIFVDTISIFRQSWQSAPKQFEEHNTTQLLIPYIVAEVCHRMVADVTEMESARLLVKRLSVHATVPVRASKGAAGAYDVSIPARGKAIVKTDLSIAVPPDCYGRIAPRSGLAVKHFLDVGVSKGDRIAQLILQKICTPDVEEVQNLTDTERGEGGYGSTGKQ
eukprot:gene3560-6170_t